MGSLSGLRLVRAERVLRLRDFAVDRSRFAGCTVQPLSPEAEAMEERLRAIRQAATMAEKMAAWRAFASGR